MEGVGTGAGGIGARLPADGCSLARLIQRRRRPGPIGTPTSSRIEALSLPQLEELALALRDFRGAQDLQTWLEPLDP